MRVAFVGKGGSGKTTLCSQFCKFIISKDKRLLIIDADLNMHMRYFFGVSDLNSSLTDFDVVTYIKEYVKGENPLITDPLSIISTTPPGKGSRLVTLEKSDALLSKIAAQVDGAFFLQVGVPIEYDFGIRCYHVNMEVAEILLGHTNENFDDFVVVDMTAGADAFATSMYAHFDVMFIVVEPTLESLTVYEDYLRLGEKFGVREKLVPLANQVEDEADACFLKEKIPSLEFMFPKSIELKKILREQKAYKILPDFVSIFECLYTYLYENVKTNKGDRLKRIHEMHRVIAKKPHNLSAFGDLTSQIDTDFTF